MRQMGTHRWTVGAVDVIRVADPGFELVLPQDHAAAALLAASAWLRPQFVTDDQALRVGSSAIAVRTPSATIVVDPFLAFDDPARLAPRLAALRAAGVEPDDVDLVVNTHIDGIGANVLADGSPAFGSARYLIPAAELEDAAGGLRGDPGIALVALQKEGRADAVIGGETLVPGVRLDDAPGHSQGHVVVWIESGGSQAVVTGHLFLHPAQLANPDVYNDDVDPSTLVRTRRSLLARCVRDDATLIGPLFAAPGGGKVRQDGDGWRLQVPASR
jgi:glyoxylase-like metal-dependent hydrolase (beta-lactamase superfamily II)